MGLSTTHNCWDGGYMGFTIWRNAVAKAAGYAISDAGEGIPAPVVNWASFKQCNYMGEWDKVPEDPLLILIVHADCDGVIKSKHCKLLANRMEELIPILEDDPSGRPNNITTKTQQFIEGLLWAANDGEDVEFH